MTRFLLVIILSYGYLLGIAIRGGSNEKTD